jgi:hypothetical protein
MQRSQQSTKIPGKLLSSPLAFLTLRLFTSDFCRMSDHFNFLHIDSRNLDPRIIWPPRLI